MNYNLNLTEQEMLDVKAALLEYRRIELERIHVWHKGSERDRLKAEAMQLFRTVINKINRELCLRS